MSTKKTKDGSKLYFVYLGMLQTIFITMKLTGVLTWSWFWILSPLELTCALGMIGSMIMMADKGE